MKYRWEITFQRLEREESDDGFEERVVSVVRKGVIEENGSGANVARAIISKYEDQGNLVGLEVNRVG